MTFLPRQGMIGSSLMSGEGMHMNHHDPTADRAVGSVAREWNRMMGLAIRIRQRPQGVTAEVEKQFTGIYRRLLTDPLEELIRERPKGR